MSDRITDGIGNGMVHGKGNSLCPEPCALIPNLTHPFASTGRGDFRALANSPKRAPRWMEK